MTPPSQNEDFDTTSSSTLPIKSVTEATSLSTTVSTARMLLLLLLLLLLSGCVFSDDGLVHLMSAHDVTNQALNDLDLFGNAFVKRGFSSLVMSIPKINVPIIIDHPFVSELRVSTFLTD
jgi:hypothetical protein